MSGNFQGPWTPSSLDDTFLIRISYQPVGNWWKFQWESWKFHTEIQWLNLYIGAPYWGSILKLCNESPHWTRRSFAIYCKIFRSFCSLCSLRSKSRLQIVCYKSHCRNRKLTWNLSLFLKFFSSKKVHLIRLSMILLNKKTEIALLACTQQYDYSSMVTGTVAAYSSITRRSISPPMLYQSISHRIGGVIADWNRPWT